MKVQTLWPIWAMLVRLKLKKIETRDKRTSLRGPLAIHASKMTDNDLHVWETVPVIREALQRFGVRTPEHLITGAIVAVVDVVDLFPTGPAHAALRDELLRRHRIEWTDEQRAFGDYAPGRYGWILDNIRPLAYPIPARGWPGMWDHADQPILDELARTI